MPEVNKVCPYCSSLECIIGEEVDFDNQLLPLYLCLNCGAKEISPHNLISPSYNLKQDELRFGWYDPRPRCPHCNRHDMFDKMEQLKWFCQACKTILILNNQHISPVIKNRGQT